MPMMVGTEARAAEAAGGNAAVPDVEGVQQDPPLIAPHWATSEVLTAVVAHADTVVRLCAGFGATAAEHPEPAMAKTAAVL